MCDSRVSRLSWLPVAVIRRIMSSVWSPVDHIIYPLFGYQRRILQRVYIPFNWFGSSNQRRDSDICSLLTGVPEPTSEQVSNAVRGIHKNAINILTNQLSEKSQLNEYKSVIEKWKEESKEVEKSLKFDEIDNKKLRTLALSFKKLKALKAKKNKITKLNNERMSKMANGNTFTNADASIIKECNKSLNEIDAEMSKNKKECLDIVNTSEKLCKNDFVKNLLNEPLHDSTLDPQMFFNIFVAKLRVIANQSQMENSDFNNSLVHANDKLDKLLNVTENILSSVTLINDIPGATEMQTELATLKSQLEQERSLLKNIVRERDIMKTKLAVLEEIIEEQMGFLNSHASVQ